MRPGLAHAAIAIDLPAELATRARESAKAEGMAIEPWVSLVVESERVLALVASPASRSELVDALDRIATQSSDPAFGAAEQLAAYAHALRRAARAPNVGPAPAADPVGSDPRRTRLRLPVPYHSASAWRRAATEAGDPVDRWALGLLSRLPPDRPLWEAAASESGATLGEWIAVQAARRAS